MAIPYTPPRHLPIIHPTSPFDPFPSPSSDLAVSVHPIGESPGPHATERRRDRGLSADVTPSSTTLISARQRAADFQSILDAFPVPVSNSTATKPGRESSANTVVMATTTSRVGLAPSPEIVPRRPSAFHTPSPKPSSSHASPSPSASLASPQGSPHSPIPIDQSFMRWSKTASTILSDAPSSHFYFTKRSTATFSELGLASGSAPDSSKSLPLQESGSASQSNGSYEGNAGEVTPPVGTRRASAGTFGSNQRRWSAVPSSSTGSGRDQRERHGAHRPGESYWDKADDEESTFGSGRSRRARRPLSMSSASNSTHSGSSPLAPDIGRLNTAPSGFFPSPTQRRPSHQSPESDQAIQTHLLKTSSQNDHRIVPRTRPAPFSERPGTAPKPRPPSSGTPLRGGPVKEESANSSEGEVRCNAGRRIGKLDQVLGEGAETARVLMEFERRAIVSAVETVGPNLSRPVPPPRGQGHRFSASVPPALPPTPTSARRSQAAQAPSLSRVRSASVESLPSLHPSLAESVNTLTNLLPTKAAAKALPSLPIPSAKNSAPLINLAARNDLPPEQRAILLRRARKLEQVLGEPLSEERMGRLVVEPSNSSVIGLTATNFGQLQPPVSHLEPEWASIDVEPRTVRESSGAGAVTSSGLARSGTYMAKKAKATLGLRDKQEGEDLGAKFQRGTRAAENGAPRTASEPGTEASAGVNGHAWDDSVNATLATAAGEQEPTTPTSPIGTVDLTALDRDEGDETRRTRRQQVAKLHRLLGVPIPASLVFPTAPLEAEQLPANKEKDARARRSASPAENSFISFDDNRASTSWTAKLRSAVNASMRDKSGYPSSAKDSVTDALLRKGDEGKSRRERSFADLGEQRALSVREKAVARKKAAKLEQVFGDAPPLELFLRTSGDSGTREGGRRSDETTSAAKIDSGAFDAYQNTLESLLFLAEHDQVGLANIVDELEVTAPAPGTIVDIHRRGFTSGPSDGGQRQRSVTTSLGARLDANAPSMQSPLLSSPTSPPVHPRPNPYISEHASPDDLSSADPNSHSARRHRAAKLSQFFGETGVDYSQPNPPNPEASGKGGLKPSRKTTRRDTLDGVLGEMWSGVQAEVKRGGLRGEEVVRLGELMGALRRRGEGAWEEL